MVETKLSLSLYIPGAQRLSEQECLENPKTSYNTESINVVCPNKNGKGLHKETLVIQTRKNRLITQIINICKEAYESMIDPTQPPTEKLNKHIFVPKIVGVQENGKPKKIFIESTVWGQYSETQRLKWHLSKIAESLGAVKFEYKIFED